jgi:Tol biopolymer transport system component/predicted Ser/Thr protein kinase
MGGGFAGGQPGQQMTEGTPMLGRRIGKFQVEEEIGRGGMGVVYRAVDTGLGRSVAIKVLPEGSVGADAGRFDREARLLAALNHPNIAAIYGTEDFDGTRRALVLEYVPGQTLADRIRSGTVTRHEALLIACRVADALEAAHARGIVHRDLKPANVKITADDTVKVLDFGLAKICEPAVLAPAGAESATRQTMHTDAFTVVGTPAYMSPEQALGKPVDRRTDLWAFGCLLFELLTGRRAFTGETASDLMEAVIARDPQWQALPRDLDARVSRLLHRCLEKDPRKRLCDAGDARLELEDVLAGVPLGPTDARRPNRFWPALAVAAVALPLGVAAALLLGATPVEAPPPQVTRFTVTLPHEQRITPGWNPAILFRPEGSAIGYFSLADGRNHERYFADLELRTLAIEGSRLFLQSYSPDGRWAAVWGASDGRLQKVSLAGGAPVPLADVDMFGRGDWGTDGYIYFTEKYPGAIARVPEDGGPKEVVTELDAERHDFVHKHAQLLPDRRALIFTSVTSQTESYDDARVEVIALDTRQRTVLVEGGFSPRYSPSGHVVYARGGSLYAVPFDVASREVTGPAVKVLDGVLMSTNTGSAYFDVSKTGSLAYATGASEGGARTVVWVDRRGTEEPLPLSPRSYLFPRISPDQKTLAIEVEGATHNLYSYDLARGVLTKLTTDGLSHAPVWAADGQTLCYRSWKAGRMTMWQMPADRSGPDVRLTEIAGSQSAVAVSADGRYLTFNQMAAGAPMRAYVLPLAGPGTPQPIEESRFAVASAKFSPDGRFVAYCSNESGRPEVFVRPWPGPGPKIQASNEGGVDPLWARSGTEIFYRAGDKMMAVPVSRAQGLQLGRPRMLWEREYSEGMSSSCGPPGVSSGNYDVTADGQRFLMIKDDAADVFSTNLVVVLNWAAELTRLVAEGARASATRQP